jgi:hypothetical protein
MKWRAINFEKNVRAGARARARDALAPLIPLKCPICKDPVVHDQDMLILFGQQKQLDDQRELQEIVIEKMQTKERLRQEQFSKRAKKQFLKQINRQIQDKTLEANNGQAFEDWNDQVASLWMKKISETHKQLEMFKKIKVTH